MILHLQSRWGSTLARILRLWRKRISVSVAWRPLYDHALRSWRTQETSYEGEMGPRSFEFQELDFKKTFWACPHQASRKLSLL